MKPLNGWLQTCYTRISYIGEDNRYSITVPRSLLTCGDMLFLSQLLSVLTNLHHNLYITRTLILANYIWVLPMYDSVRMTITKRTAQLSEYSLGNFLRQTLSDNKRSFESLWHNFLFLPIKTWTFERRFVCLI